MDENKTELVQSLLLWVSVFVNASLNPREGFDVPVLNRRGCQRQQSERK